MFRVYQAVEELGPGVHPMWRIIENTKYTKSTVHRILSAGVRAQAFVHPRQGQYGLARGRLATPAEGLPDSAVMDDGVLYRELSLLQRQTAQVVMVFSAVLVAGTGSRLCLHSNMAKRADFQAALARCTPQIRDRLTMAPLHADAAGLVIQAYLDDAPASRFTREIRAEGHALTPAPVPGWEMLAAPLFRGRSVTGALAVLGLPTQIQRHRHSYVPALMQTAARMSRRSEGASAMALTAA
ncbi:helix-turn-helix domain-containing protein [Streptomyces sp. NPDC001948]